MDIDPDQLGEEAKPESQKIAEIKGDQNSIEKRIERIEKQFDDLKILNMELMLSDMHQLGLDVDDGNKLLDMVGTIEQFERLDELERKRGTDLAYMYSKAYLQDARRDRLIAQVSLTAVKDLMNRLQEKMIVSKDRGMLADRDGLDDDILQSG